MRPEMGPRLPRDANEQFWRDFLTRGDSRERSRRVLYRRIPSEPRCRLCAAPFGGIGAPIMRLLGKAPSDANPTMCNRCFDFVAAHHGGAEIEATLMFADVRGSTALAERTSPGEFHALLDRFYRTATKVVFDHDGAVDKFVGDEIVAMFFPLLSGDEHSLKGVEAAQALLRATGHGSAVGAWIPVGAGVHTARVWFGAVGDGSHVELTALGDGVNVAARLASAAAAGEVLVTTTAAERAGLDASFERRRLDLKGKELSTDVVVVTAGRALRGEAGARA